MCLSIDDVCRCLHVCVECETYSTSQSQELVARVGVHDLDSCIKWSLQSVITDTYIVTRKKLTQFLEY